MSFNLSNVYPVSDTFESWITKTNYGLEIISTVAVTTAPNTVGGYTSGNAQVNGIFSANTIAVVSGLRGGDVATSNVLNLVSNVDSRASYINVFTTAANVVITGTGKTLNIAVPTTINSNLLISSSAVNVFVNTTNADFAVTKLNLVGDVAVWNVAGTGTKLFNVVSSTNVASFTVETLNTVANSVTSNVTTGFTVNGGNVALRSSNATIGNSTVFALRATNDGTTTATSVGGNTITIAANVTVSAATANLAGVTVNGSNTTFGGSGNLTIATASANVSSNLYVTGANTTFDKTVSLNGNVFFTSDVFNTVVSNTDIGTGTSAALNVYTFAKSSYATAEITAVAVNGSNTQITKLLLAHDGTNIYSTAYGTIAVPNTANVGVFSTAISGSDVNLRFKQTTDNSSIKLIVNLIK